MYLQQKMVSLKSRLMTKQVQICGYFFQISLTGDHNRVNTGDFEIIEKCSTIRILAW